MTQQDAFGRLFEDVYAQLRAMAQRQMHKERSGHSLGATELVHQAYLRLVGSEREDIANHPQLVHAVAEAMHRILVEHARRRARFKRGGDRKRMTLSLAEQALPQEPEDFLALDEALGRLREQDPRAADVVRLRFFAGLTIDQTADAMKLSPRTIKREWEWARAWLAKHLN